MDHFLPDPLDAPHGGLAGPQNRILEIVTSSNEIIPLDLDEIVPTMLDETDNEYDYILGILGDENATVGIWVRITEELWRREAPGLAIQAAQRGIKVLREQRDHIPLYCMLATYHLSLARKAPRTILQNPRAGRPLVHSTAKYHPEASIQDDEAPPRTKEMYYELAGKDLTMAAKIDGSDKRVKDNQAALLMARGKLEEASKAFESILAVEPNNLFALMGRARASFSRRSFGPSLKAYQQVLKFAPKFLPDPRIGIGLCLWMMNDKPRAKIAWERSRAVNPGMPSNNAVLLLGLAHLNTSRDVTLPGGDEGRIVEYDKAFQLIPMAFRADNTLAGAAAPLAAHMLSTHQYEKAMKLGERAIQFADARILISEGHLTVARTLHAEATDMSDPKMVEAVTEYQAAAQLNPDQLMALLAIGQYFIWQGNWPAAVNQYEVILRRSPRCIEALVSLASCHTHLALTDKDKNDALNSRKAAKEQYDAIIRLFASGKDGVADKEVNKAVAKSGRIKSAARNVGLFLEVARLWSDETNLSKSLQAYREAARIEEEENDLPVQPQLLNNIGVLEYQKKNFEAARDKFEDALTRAVALEEGDELRDAVLVAVTYNAGVAYESLDDLQKAEDAYKQILGVHPEYVDAKARLALMLLKNKNDPNAKKNFDQADQYIKESLSSQPRNLELRALYSFFLSETAAHRVAKEFSVETLRQHSRNDLYSLCTAGMVDQLTARENRNPSQEGQKERAAKFFRAAEFYQKALQLDPLCAFAAQGTAILVAEGFLGTGLETSGSTPVMSESAQRSKNSRDALAMLTKVQESINDSSVYINIGHCHTAREEWDRAIENYETALRKYAGGKSISILLYLARAWYHKANADQSFASLRPALKAAQSALELTPGDLSITFNCALILQKGIEILFDLPLERRTLLEIHEGIEQNLESQKLFEQLQATATTNTPYPPDLPKQRQKYGQTLDRRSGEIINAQQAYEASEQAKLDRAKQLRDKERKEAAEQEATRLAEITRAAEALAEQRRAMREEAEQWALSKGFADSDEEDKKKKAEKGKKRKAKAKREDGEESSGEEEQPKPKKKKAKPPKVVDGGAGGEGDGKELDSDGDEAVRPVKRKTGRGGRAFKSNEYIDSDDDSDV